VKKGFTTKASLLLLIYRFQDPFTLTNTSGLKYSWKSDVPTGAVPKLGNFFFHVMPHCSHFLINLVKIMKWKFSAMYLLAMCYSQFFGEKKDYDQNPVSCTKKIAYFWFPQGMIIFPGGERLKWNFLRGGGVYSGSRFWKIQRRVGVIGKIPSMGGMDIFWNYTM